jgi:hypothetical protein
VRWTTWRGHSRHGLIVAYGYMMEAFFGWCRASRTSYDLANRMKVHADRGC